MYSLLTLQGGHFYRGVDLSDRELLQMETLRDFYIPSFTSCSSNPNMAYDKNAKIIVKTHNTRNAATITEVPVFVCCFERPRAVGNETVHA